MCHVLLALPLLVLPIFWLAPLSIAIPVYGLIFTISVIIYWLAYRAMHLPVVTGAEALLHQVGTIVGIKNGLYKVRLNNEYWNALSDEQLQSGERVEVCSVHGNTLEVKRSKS